MKTKPEENSPELERLRAELQTQQHRLAAVLDRLKAQEESTSDAWDLLAMLWCERRVAAMQNDKRTSEEVIFQEQSALFFKGLGLALGNGNHEARIKAALTRRKK